MIKIGSQNILILAAALSFVGCADRVVQTQPGNINSAERGEGGEAGIGEGAHSGTLGEVDRLMTEAHGAINGQSNMGHEFVNTNNPEEVARAIEMAIFTIDSIIMNQFDPMIIELLEGIKIELQTIKEEFEAMLAETQGVGAGGGD